MFAFTANQFCQFGIPFVPTHPQATADMLGYVPGFISADDPRPAAEQINERYGEFGGWRPNRGWRMHPDFIAYPGDPARPMAAARPPSATRTLA